MDYSVYDAVRAGFGKVVFVIRESFEQDFREKILKKYEHIIPVATVFQELDKLPTGFALNPERVKPWGTNHAVLRGKDVIKEPFMVINADDFYGKESFAVMGEFLQTVENEKNTYSMVGYRIGNTLSESGSVARGVCASDADGFLTSVVERTAIARVDCEIQFTDENGQKVVVEENTPVSMNMWGFTPEYFGYSETLFEKFLTENQTNLKAEYFIPWAIDHLIVSGKVKVKILDTPSKWFGVTYADDRASVVEKIKNLIDKGEYPKKLF
jgi:dTDP-glucose pyrophosphorylase